MVIFGFYKLKYLFSHKFKILTGEDWNVVMYDGIVAYGGVKVRRITGPAMRNKLYVSL